MANGVKQCPECQAALDSSYRGQVIVWECPRRHGVGVNIFDSVGYLQRDEIDAIWKAAYKAPLSPLASPISGRPMSEVTFLADNDTDYDNVGQDAQQLTVELDLDNYFAWFSVAELDAMPTMEGVVVPKTSASIVGLEQLGETQDSFDHLFADLDVADSKVAKDDRSSLTGMLGGLARRMGSR